MATILLQSVGSALGGMLGGPVGAILGRAAGGLAGAAIDTALFSPTQKREGPRLGATRIMEADEGAGIPRVYGTARIAGQVIWGTRFEEESETERQGGKGGGGGVEVTTYSYFGNVAVGLCEGPIAGIRRIWADGEEIDQADHQIRVYRGDETQGPDPLIEAKQGAGNAPAYRGLAYVVFERLALERWGNRIPQISCEVLRPIGDLERAIEAVTIIPGATEHGLDPAAVRERLGPGEDRLINRNVTFGDSDWLASIDELQMLAPGLKRAALVVAWFADDLRAGHCNIMPGVEIRQRDESEPWLAGGCDRESARLISRIEGSPAYGGTPSDRGVLRALGDLKRRGLFVTHYPFMLMDIPVGNGLADSYGGDEQPPYPWRGRMSLDLAETMAGTTDRTAAARSDIEAFVGTAGPADFAWEGDRLAYRGPAEWSYRRMIFHQAHLAAKAGVDAFVIGSEMRGLTRLRDGEGRFPFVEALLAIAEDVKALLPQAIVTYAADWSEYAAYRPQDGSGDLFYNLDTLWASPAIDVVGIDNYLPLTDWRSGGEKGASTPSPYDRSALAEKIAGGEWFDWFYETDADREAGIRTPITDGVAGKPFVYRDKDLRGWWSNPHIERRGGAETGVGSAWQPEMKPIWFTELGCPAIDRGANQPNVFVDPKSSESLVPYHSRGFRDDLAQRRFLEVTLEAWREGVGAEAASLNPISSVYGGPMVAADAIHVWTWDARPYPAFPSRTDLWTDGTNWRLGHWLNGRLSNAPVDALIRQILTDHGITDFETQDLEACLDGYVVDGPRTAREDIETILDLVGAMAVESGGTIAFSTLARKREPIIIDALVDPDGPIVAKRRGEAGERPDEVAIGFSDPDRAYQPGVADALKANAASPRKSITMSPAVLHAERAERFAARLLAETTDGLETMDLSLAPNMAAIEPGDVLAIDGREGEWLVTRIASGEARKVETRRFSRREGQGAGSLDRKESPPPLIAPVLASRPAVTLLDLSGSPLGEEGGPRVALQAKPWLPYAVLAGPPGGGLSHRAIVERPAVTGTLIEPLAPGPVGVFDRAGRMTVRLDRGELATRPLGDVLAGRNAVALLREEGAREFVQFVDAEEVEPNLYVLSALIRGQGGSEAEAATVTPAGTRFLLMDEAVTPLTLSDAELGRPMALRVVPLGRPLDDAAGVTLEASLGLQAKRPLAPVHLRARFSPDGGCLFRWIRRARFGGDNWAAEEVPLCEEREAYRLAIRAGPDDTEPAVFTETSEPRFVLSLSDQMAVFGGLAPSLSLSVSQVSAVWGAGAEARRLFARPGA
ncbi:Putative phage tail protein [Fulvimarina manganoxydans]|uniref:Putative phage tail protein n=1 Tax=Fulvimarina manganoxydans TaxID=937218 RepID=A0A1W2AT70_9HYPH|nr:glycoside hydrolase/phage tail family protein [Fulvimarina manganoxydans]SMC63896.1 Putative phage tail protein [Fulvimarina manganoxydans]